VLEFYANSFVRAIRLFGELGVELNIDQIVPLVHGYTFEPRSVSMALSPAKGVKTRFG
jgi:hypothetical protein